MRLSLQSKFTLATSVLVLGVMLLFAFINMRTLRDLWIHEAIKDVDSLSETIIRTTYYQMLEDDRARVYEMIREVGAQEGIDHIRLVDKDGIISFSTDAAETGQLLDKEAAACNVCHLHDTPLAQAPSMSRSRTFRNPAGEEILGLAKGIYNQPECVNAACHAHPASAKLLGILDVTVSLTPVHERIESYRDALILLTLGLLLVLFASLRGLTVSLVTRPLQQLLDHTRRLARGELEGKVAAIRKDEIGELAESFNDMTANLRQARDELRNWGETLEVRVAERAEEIQEIQHRLMHAERLASLGELVAGIAHEVNNPLTGILMLSSLALERHDLPPQLRHDLETVVGETQRCAVIVRGLLEFSRQREPRKDLESVNVLLDSTLALVEHQALFLNIRVDRDYDAAILQILVDTSQMRQVLMNLLINAGQAMPQGGVLSVRTGVKLSTRQIFVAIRDSGCGIAAEHLSKIFDPFFTTKDHVGTGLGLAVSYGIVKSHGGEIEVESRPGEGALFTLLLPLPPAGEGEKPV
ncbi:MAG: two-component sensor histidine kinase [Desulfuromonadales bacterium GWC2_61_20]|nr:MAG: two-component sensor histidine kinase [Desulfuromonadales bacterium GWC2_61_20]HAD04385.1 two-component sensor histidine kinase [Desulfuromonas sp.]